IRISGRMSALVPRCLPSGRWMLSMPVCRTAKRVLSTMMLPFSMAAGAASTRECCCSYKPDNGDGNNGDGGDYLLANNLLRPHYFVPITYSLLPAAARLWSVIILTSVLPGTPDKLKQSFSPLRFCPHYNS